MTEEGKKHFDLYRFLCFPWGAFVSSAAWLGIVKVLEEILSNFTYKTDSGEIEKYIPWWCAWVVFAIGVVAIFIISAVYCYSLPKGKKTGHNVFVLISPEYSQDDKYITTDFVENFERHANGSIDGLNIIVPAMLKRETFNRVVNRYQRAHKKYWDSKRWKRLHKKLKGSLYISGSLRRRMSAGKEHFVFNLSVTVGYNNINKDIAPLMIAELKNNFPPRILINKEFEVEEFDKVSDRFATFSEYLLGWAHLVSGNIGLAFKMHRDIYTNNKQSFFKKGALKDLKQLLHYEVDAIITDCKVYPISFVSACVAEAEKLFPDSDTATVLAARFYVMTTTEEQFKEHVLRAQSLLNKAKINANNRDVVHANRAYVALLRGNYPQAETEYKSLFKKQNKQLDENVINYCNEQIKNGCNSEKPTAYYVKVLMLQYGQYSEEEIQAALEKAKKSIPGEMTYYHNKLNTIMESSIACKKKSQKKKHRK